MRSTIRIPQAPTEPLPELAEFLKPFRAHFTRSEGRHALDRYLTGLLTELPNKNCDTIAASIPGTSEQQLQGLLTTTAWNEEDLNGQRVRRLTRLTGEGDGVLIFDDTGFAKQGRCSVGVARQYSGTLGKTGNCQVVVNCHRSYAVDGSLYRGCARYDRTAWRTIRALASYQLIPVVNA